MANIKLYVAVSLDGYIAGPDGGVEWLDRYQADGEDYGYADFYDSVDTLLMGGNTYRAILHFGCGWPYEGKRTYVVSRRERSAVLPGVSVVSDDAIPFLRRLRAEEKRDIWLVGGGLLVSQLLAEGLVDEMRLCVFPLLLGRGIRLFPDSLRSSERRLVGQRTFPSGAVMLTYR